MLAADVSNFAGRIGVESAKFLNALGARYSLEDVFETAPILSQKSGGNRGLRVFSLRNVEPVDRNAQRDQLQAWGIAGLPVLSSWDQVKAHVDEAIHRIDIKEAESQSIDLERAAANESYQRPYLAFSKVGEARTMVPANLQSASQSYMTRLETVYGPVDEFIEKQMGMGIKTLSANFSPEQVDGMAVMISRYLVGRSSLLADDTGIGKGRQLAGVATWANKRGHDVIFVTDRSNLFSDLARDLKDIGEWDRFRPLVFNADGEITHEEVPGTEPVVLARGTSAADMASIMERNLSFGDLQCNIAFLTYSQISTEESAKALWLKNQLGNALVIFDEAHIAAGSDSNIAVQVAEIASLAKHVQFASATWAKTHDNMHIYQRAFPASVAVGTLTETMRKGGDSFSEIFSTMLSAEGALIRREHDLSKLEVEMVIDSEHRARNEDVSDKVADVLGSASFISGDMQQVFIRANAESVSRLRGARDVRAVSVKAKLFSSSFGAGSVIYQVMKSVQGALNATHVADLAIDSVAKGMKPVIVSDATGESLLEAMIEEMIQASNEAERPELLKMPTLRDMLRHVIYKRLATVRVEEVDQLDVMQDDEEAAGLLLHPAAAQVEEELPVEGGAEVLALAPVNPEAAAQPEEAGVEIREAFNALTAVAATGAAAAPADDLGDGDAESDHTPRAKRRKRIFKDVLVSDLPEMPAQAKERYAAGLKEIEDKIMAVPDMPVLGFDVITQRLRDAGISVGEISGRKNSLVRVGEEHDSNWRLAPRAKSKKAVKATIRSFNNGTTRALVLNRSAATGVSLHSSPRFLDQSRRHLIEHQIPEDPVIRIQLLGRVNRYDQLSSPLITTASTGIYGEVRYLMMQNRKLARMSANVRSSRDNAMSLKGVTDLFNIVGRQAVQAFLQDNPLISKRLGITDADVDGNPDIVNKLTMRIPLLRVIQQEIVYNELYSRVDEIMLRAELDGENPLRPNEMDIRAQTESEIVFFGDDTPADEFTSAFDAPVMARRLKWVQERNPLSYTAVMEAAKVNIERLVESGYLVVETPGADPKVNPQLLAKVINGYHGLTRLAHMATDAAEYDDAMTSFTAAKRSYLKYQWIKANLERLLPGTKVGSTADPSIDLAGIGGDAGWDRATIITDVRPPVKDEELLDPGKWKLTVVTSGEDRPQTYTMRSLLTAMKGSVYKGAITGDLTSALWGPYFGTGMFHGAQTNLRNQFDLVMRGKRTFKATALAGNMYLAAEWAAATKKGVPAIYSDDAGHRHRVILLAEDVGHIEPEYLPVRVSDHDMLLKLLEPLAAPETQAPADERNPRRVHIMDTTFKSALASMSSGASVAKRDAILAILPGHLLALSCSPKDMRRIRSALTAGQNGIRKSIFGPQSRTSEDPAHVVVRSHGNKKDIAKLPEEIQRAMKLVTGMSAATNLFAVASAVASEKTGGVAVLSLEIKTPEQVSRALELIRRHSGLEVYVSTRELKELARDAIRDVLNTRRTAMRALQEEMRVAVGAASSRLDSQPVVEMEVSEPVADSEVMESVP